MFEICGTTVSPYLETSTPVIFMLTTSDGIVTDPGRLHPCVGRPSSDPYVRYYVLGRRDVMRGAVQCSRLWNHGCFRYSPRSRSIPLSNVLSILTLATALWQVQGWLAHTCARPAS